MTLITCEIIWLC